MDELYKKTDFVIAKVSNIDTFFHELCVSLIQLGIEG